MTLDRFVGREPDRLSLREQLALAGNWIALERYDPRTLPERKIAAVGVSAPDCIRKLTAQGLDIRKYEVSLVPRPY